MPVINVKHTLPKLNGVITSSRQSGFTLIEVLVTAVILTIGLLGLAGLQYNSLQGNQGAQMNTVAVLQALDAADRLRSNPVGVASNEYDNLVGDPGENPGCISSENGCNSAQLADYDYWIWSVGDPEQPGTGNATLLPSGEGVICLDSTPEDGTDKGAHGCDFLQTGIGGSQVSVFAVKVWWDDDRDPETPHRRHVLSVLP